MFIYIGNEKFYILIKECFNKTKTIHNHSVKFFFDSESCNPVLIRAVS